MSIAMPSAHFAPTVDQPTRQPAPASLASTVESDLFDRDELRQFAEDDSQAGRQICKILVALFVYPLIVMTGAIWWTLHTMHQ